MDIKTAQPTMVRDKAMKPWQHSTFAKTIEGKARVSRNAFKGGTRKLLKT